MTINAAEINWSAHRVALDPMYGVGLLVRPRPAEDVADPFADGATYDSVHDLELYEHVLPDLDRLGFEPCPLAGEDPTDEYEYDWTVDSTTEDGRDVVSLFGREPIVDSPTPGQVADSFAAMRLILGL